MRLSDYKIKSYIKKKKLIISPMPNKNQIHGITLDIRLGNKFRTFSSIKNKFINLSKTQKSIQYDIKKIMNKEIILSDKDIFILNPGEFILTITYESFTLPSNLVGWIDGRSSLARLGLMIHMTSHRIDPGWKGAIVLECFNAGKIKLALQPKMIICALSFELIHGRVINTYNTRKNAKYYNQKKIFLSKIDKDEKNK